MAGRDAVVDVDAVTTVTVVVVDDSQSPPSSATVLTPTNSSRSGAEAPPGPGALGIK